MLYGWHLPNKACSGFVAGCAAFGQIFVPQTANANRSAARRERIFMGKEIAFFLAGWFSVAIGFEVAPVYGNVAGLVSFVILHIWFNRKVKHEHNQ